MVSLFAAAVTIGCGDVPAGSGSAEYGFQLAQRQWVTFDGCGNQSSLAITVR